MKRKDNIVTILGVVYLAILIVVLQFGTVGEYDNLRVIDVVMIGLHRI